MNREVLEQEEQELSSDFSTVIEQQLIEAAGLLESGGRYHIGTRSKEVQTSTDFQHAVQTSTDSQHPNYASSTTACTPNAKFDLLDVQYNEDRSKIVSFSCSLCEHRFQYSGQRYMTRHIHTCCEKYPVKAQAFGLATGTCISCLQGKPCERNSTSAASTPATTSLAGTAPTETSLDDIPGACIDNIAVVSSSPD
jgi:hypothetical protein